MRNVFTELKKQTVENTKIPAWARHGQATWLFYHAGCSTFEAFISKAFPFCSKGGGG